MWDNNLDAVRGEANYRIEQLHHARGVRVGDRLNHRPVRGQRRLRKGRAGG